MKQKSLESFTNAIVIAIVFSSIYVTIELSTVWTFLKRHGYCSISHTYDAKKSFEIGHRFALPNHL